MIAAVQGVPGAGKTYYGMRVIAQAILAGKFVATNVKLVDDWPERIANTTVLRWMPRRRAQKMAEWRRRVAYVEDVDELARIRLGTRGFEKQLEGRGVVVLDEAGEWLDSRSWADDKDKRHRTNRFFRQHRKLGWDVYLIAQDVEHIDKQVRDLAEFTVTLRNLRRFKPFLGIPLWPFGNLFLALWFWSGVRLGRPMRKQGPYTLNKKIAGLYDTHQIVHEVGNDEGHELVWLPLPAGDPAAGGRSAAAAADPSGSAAPSAGVTVAGIDVGPPLVPFELPAHMRPGVPQAPELATDDPRGRSDHAPISPFPPPPPEPPAAADPTTPLGAPQAPLAPSMQAFPSAPGSEVATVTAPNAERPPLTRATAPANDVKAARRGPGQRYPAR